MSSSTFEVIETEDEPEKDLNFGIEACEESEVEISQVEGEIQKDHTYTKDPDIPYKEDGEEGISEKAEADKADVVPEKNTKSSKNKRASKASKNVRVKSPKKKAPPAKKGKVKKEVLTEESKSDENLKPGKSGAKDVEEPTRSSKRPIKRKMEEKENVIDQSIVEEVQNINEGESTTETNPKRSARNKTETPKAKMARKSNASTGDIEDTEGMPKGWVRKVVFRKSGKSAGQFDVYIYSPDGTKLRSRPDLAAYLAKTKSNLKLEDFNFSKKIAPENSVNKTTSKKEKSVPSPKPKNTPEKKAAKEHSTPKKRSKLVVKICFSPKKKNTRNVKKSSDEETKPAKVSKKAKAPSSKNSKKKKGA